MSQTTSAAHEYLEPLLWEATGRPAKGSWFVDTGLSEADGLALAARIEQFRDPRSGYQLWRGAGLHNSGAALGFGRRP